MWMMLITSDKKFLHTVISFGTNFCDYKCNPSERESGIHFAQQIEF